MLKYSIAAVALVASSTFALADPNTGGPGGAGPSGGAGGAAMEHSGSGSGGSPAGAMKGGATQGNGGPGMTRGDAGPSKNSDNGMKGDRSSAAQDRFGGAKKNAASGESPSKGDRQQATGENRNSKDGKRQASDNDRNMKNRDSEHRDDRAERNDQKTSNQARDNSRANKAATGASEGTGGKAGPRGSLTNISPEQKTRVRSAFSGHRVAPARDIGVAVNVGVVVPRSVHFYPLPPAIVTIAPDYSGYEYFMIDESHVAIVDPETLEVVDIIVVA